MSFRQVSTHHGSYVKTNRLENIDNVMLKKFVNLDICINKLENYRNFLVAQLVECKAHNK